MDYQQINTAETVVIAAGAWALFLGWTLRRLRRTRPGLAIGRPVATGLVLRALMALGVSATGVAASLRGADESGFLAQAQQIANAGWSSSLWVPSTRDQLHVLLFAFQFKLGFSEPALRITQLSVAVVGTVLLAAAVYDLAGPRPARLAAWLLAVEPASIFFAGVLHKEALTELAGGLVILGGVKVWRTLSPAGIAMMALGCAIALGTRYYVGYFLISGSLFLGLHAAVRSLGRGKLRGLPVLFTIAAAFFVATPFVLAQTSSPQLKVALQASQDANTGVSVPLVPGTGNDLALEKVDFSSRSALISNLPQRIGDILFRPYPWQVANTSEQLGAVGSIIALMIMALLFLQLVRRGATVLTRAAPLAYPTVFLLIAYALSVGNAGTGFRYRTHLVSLFIVLLVILRSSGTAASGGGSDRPGAKASYG